MLNAMNPPRLPLAPRRHSSEIVRDSARARRSFVPAGVVPLAIVLFVPSADTAPAPTREQAATTLRKAVEFYSTKVARHGGYVYAYSGDLKLAEGEGVTGPDTIWVQPPGTPAVGEAFLDAFEATGEALHLNAARAAGAALLKGQLHSGGWDHGIEFDPARRAGLGYRDQPAPKKPKASTSLDDDITPAAIRFLARLDRTLQFKDAKLNEAVRHALKSVVTAQYPNGGWYQNWSSFPQPPSPKEFPVLKASYPKTWPRQWLNDWPGRYFINDNVIGNVINTLLLAHDIYGDDAYLAAARKGGDFLLLAQMPDPQPAWAQQYDPRMHPCWDRKFEPPAISSWESQFALETLLTVCRRTGERKYLEPFPRALAYLRKSLLPDGRFARFYELQSNRPLYFKRTGKLYELTYSDADLPDHYGFKQPSRLAAIEAEYRRLAAASPAALNAMNTAKTNLPPPAELAAGAGAAIRSLDARGAWVEQKAMRHHRATPASGVIDSQTFITNVRTLSEYIRAAK
jgi:hypothetical protein